MEELIGKIVGALGLSFFKKVVGRLQSSEEKVIIPHNQEIFSELITNIHKIKNQLEEMPAKDYEKLKEGVSDFEELEEFVQVFSENYAFISVNGKYAIADREVAEEDINANLTEGEHPQRNVIPTNQAEQYIPFRELAKPISPEMKETIAKLDITLQTLTHLSAHIERLYKEDKSEQAEEMKDYIGARFGGFGYTFSNLYQQYIKNMLLILSDRSTDFLNERIRRFVEYGKRNVFFIYGGMNVEEMSSTTEYVGESLRRGEDYVAVHSLGKASTLAKAIVGSIDVEAEEDLGLHEYKTRQIDSDREYSRIWYKGDRGKELLDFFSRF